MACGHFDCFSGVAGDMVLGALVDASWPLTDLQEVVRRLNLPDVAVTAERVRRGGIAGTHVRVNIGPGGRKAHRHLPQILDIIGAAQLPPPVAENAERVFRRLAEAEASVHGIAVEKVHFHEVGAADAIVDIVASCAGLHALGITQFTASAIPTGHGTVVCEHGTLPIPAPATAALLQGVPLDAADEPVELTTPTGAAIVTTLAAAYGPPPPMTLDRVGYGAGTRENRTRPNLLRLLIGTPQDAGVGPPDTVVVLEAQVDDAPGQVVAYACERLLGAGALDAFIVPIIMKKGRPAQLITVLARSEDVARLEDVLFAETTTLGVRRHTARRSTLDRAHETIATRFGEIRMKIGRRGDAVVRAWPEYDDCAAAARQHGVSLRCVQDEALREWSQREPARNPRRPG